MQFNSIKNEELLYRSIIPFNPEVTNNHYTIDPEEGLKFTSQAFNDRGNKPSVTRAKLIKNTPERAKLGENQGVTKLYAYEVRAIDLTQDNLKKYSLDVIPRKRNGQIGHSQIEASPELYGSNSQVQRDFKRIQISLARIASKHGWALKPNDSNYN